MKTTNPNATEALIALEVAEAVKAERERCAGVCENAHIDTTLLVPISAREHARELARQIRKGATP